MAKSSMSDRQLKKKLDNLREQFRSEPLINASDPAVYREVCRKYSEIVTPGLEAADRALLLSRATAHTRVYKSS